MGFYIYFSNHGYFGSDLYQTEAEALAAGRKTGFEFTVRPLVDSNARLVKDRAGFAIVAWSPIGGTRRLDG